jgi:hypothetical protein
MPKYPGIEKIVSWMLPTVSLSRVKGLEPMAIPKIFTPNSIEVTKAWERENMVMTAPSQFFDNRISIPPIIA